MRFGKFLLLSFSLVPILPCANAQTTQIGLTASAGVSNNNTPPWPLAPGQISVYRELGANVNWAYVETSSGVYNWTHFDATTNFAIAQGATKIEFQIWQTPTWASSNPGDTNCSDTTYPGSCDPPSDLNSDGTGTNALFKAYVTSVMTRAAAQWPGITRVYALWNEPSAGPTKWTGTNAQLVRMQTDAINLRNSLDATGLILSSPFAGLWSTSGQNAFTSFLSAGGAVGVDRIGYHGYLNPATNVASDEINVILSFVRSAVKSAGLTAKLANTEYSWADTSSFTGDQVAWVGQTLLLQQQPDIDYINWYGLNFPFGTLVTDANAVTQFNLSPAGIAFQQISGTWIPPGSILGTACAPLAANATITTCQGRKSTTYGYDLFVWSSAPTSYTFPMGTYQYMYDTQGNKTVIDSAASVPVSPEPVRLVPAAPIVPPTPGNPGHRTCPWWHIFCNCGCKP